MFRGFLAVFVSFCSKIDLFTLLKLKEIFTFKFCTYNRIKHSFALLYSDFCVSEIFLCFTEFLIFVYVMVF